MKQQKFKKIMERIRSKQNNETNEQVATAGEVSMLNATNEATMSVASARAITTATISADNYLYLESYDEEGNMFEEAIIGNYEGKMYTLVGRLDMSALLAANNISASADLSAYSLTLYGDDGDFSWAYSIYDLNGNFITHYYGNGMEIYVPLKEVYDVSGDWFFVLEPATGYDCLYFSGAGNLEVSYNENPLVGISITTPPIKTAYLAGEKFDPTGMVVTATYSNGETETLTSYGYLRTSLTAGMTSITISHTDGDITKTATQAITVTVPGKEGYFGNRNISVSNYGENPIWNIQTMGLRYFQQGLSIGMNSYAIGANLVYDSQMKDRLQDMCEGMPKGWKLDAHQFIVQDGEDDDGEATYKYIDGQGYVHTFEKYLGSNTDCYDTEGAGLVLTVNSGYVIKDQDDNEMHFNASGRLVKTVSGKNSDNIKHYQYDYSGRLTRIYDNRKATRYVEFTYSSNLLHKIKTYDEKIVGGEKVSELFETLTLVYTNNNITGVEKERGEHYKEMNSFTYDEYGKLNLIVGEETKNATQITYGFDMTRNDYAVKKISYGYMNKNNVFKQKTYESCTDGKALSDSNLYCEITLENEKGVKIAYKLDSDGNIVAPLERMTDENVYKTMQKDIGIKIDFEDTTNNSDETINGKQAKYLDNSNVITEVDLAAVNIKNSILKDTRYCKLSFWFKYTTISSSRLFVNLKYAIGGNVYDAFKEIDVKQINVWQKIEIPIDLQEDCEEITDLKLYFNNYGSDLVNFNPQPVYKKITGQVCNFRLFSSSCVTLKVGNNTFEDITAVLFDEPDEMINFKTGDYKFTESDFIKTLESYNLYKRDEICAWEVYYDNGKKRVKNTGGVYFCINGNFYDLQYFADMTEDNYATYNYRWYVETTTSDGRITSKQYRVYNTIGCLTITKTKIGDGEEQTTEQQSHYKSWDREITEENGATVKREYFEDGNLKKETIIGKDENNNNIEIVVYEAMRDSTGEYIRQETGSFDSKNYTFSKFSLDKMERSSYNGVTYKETYGYDGFEEYLETLTAYENDTQKAQNTMVYDEGELSTVSDGKAQYKFDYDKATDTSTLKVKDGTTWERLEETESDHDLNTVTHKYYREDDEVTDTFVYTTDKYGKPISETCTTIEKDANGNDVTTTYTVAYNYTAGDESEAAWVIESVEDGYSGRTYTYEYGKDGSVKSVGFNSFSVEKVNESEKKYTVGTDTITQKVVQDTKPRVITHTFNGAETPIFDRYYTYDGFSRNTFKQALKSNNDEAKTFTKLSETERGYGNDHMLPLSETYRRGEAGAEVETYKAVYMYDDFGNAETVTHSGLVNGTVAYEYDVLGRLTKETTTGSTVLANGVKIYEYEDTYGRMSSFNGTAMEYDDRGRLKTFGDIEFEYDNYGNRTKKKNKETGETLFDYTWTRGRLLDSVNTTTYTYDKDGKRTKKIVNGVTHEYFYDSNNLIAEKVGDKYFYFFYDESGVCGFRYENINYEYVKNIFGDIIGIYNEYGTHVATYAYDAWGNMIYCNAGTDVALINPFLYRGYYFDSESGLYYLMSRYYDPSIGQFISMDTPDYLAPDTIGGVDLYAYCNNNPIMFVDPTGHFPILALILGITALVGMGLTIGGVATDNNLMTAIGLTMVAIPALISGGMALYCAGAAGTMVIGGVTAVAGVGTGLFASAEYQEAFSGNNWMLDAGMSEEWYNGLMLATAAIATAGTVASMAGVTRYQNFGNTNWHGGWRTMRSHYLKHGRPEMGYRSVFDYTNGANAIINKGGVYLSNTNSYAQWIAGNKYLYVGVGRGSNLITTYFFKTIKYAKYLSLL